ncbi:hypothetical protein PG987_001346 [Apiospora arundinis]
MRSVTQDDACLLSQLDHTDVQDALCSLQILHDLLANNTVDSQDHERFITSFAVGCRGLDTSHCRVNPSQTAHNWFSPRVETCDGHESDVDPVFAEGRAHAPDLSGLVIVMQDEKSTFGGKASSEPVQLRYVDCVARHISLNDLFATLVLIDTAQRHE